MTLTPILQRLGLVLIGLGLVMGPIADPLHVTVVYTVAAFLLASSTAAELVLAGRRRGTPVHLSTRDAT